VQGAAAAALAATGVGAPAAAGILAAERGGGKLLKPGGNIGQGLRGGAEGAVMGYGASKLGGLARGAMGLGGSVGSADGDYVAGSAPTASGGGGGLSGLASSAWQKAKGIVSGGGTDNQGSFGLAGDLAGKVGGAVGGGGLADKALLALAIWQAAKDREKKEGLQNQGLAYATDAYSARQPLRHRGLELLQDESSSPDLSGIFKNAANPYTRERVPYQVSSGIPASPPVKVPEKSTY
jgi:hypothetical protein